MADDSRGTDHNGEADPGAAREASADKQVTGERSSSRTATRETAGAPLTQQVGRIVLVILAVLFLVFAVANQDPVTFNYLFGTGEVALIVLLLTSFVLGAGLGAVSAWRRGRRHRAGASNGD